MDLKFLQSLVTPAETKIVMLIMDGLGGLPLEPDGKTELETAKTPNLDALAKYSSLGLSIPLGSGITVESGPGHMALFGYDPIEYRIGRGVLEALGIGFDLQPSDVAVRGNYCTVDDTGRVTDRRANRIPTDISRELSKLLTMKIEDTSFLVETVREHRLSIVMRGPDLGSTVSGSDPNKNGLLPLTIKSGNKASEKTARLARLFVEKARKILTDYRPIQPANMILLRGFDHYPDFPSFHELYGLNAAGIAIYPTYRGIAQLVGMHVLKVEGNLLKDEFSLLENRWHDFDFFYLHIKDTDLAGEDGDFERKVRVIEEVDSLLPRVLALNPDVIIVSGDHSTPAVLKSHSWHPVPTLVHSNSVRADGIAEFGERVCSSGSLGSFPAKNIMPLVLANAKRLLKFGG